MITPGSNLANGGCRDRALPFTLARCPVRVDSPFGVFPFGSPGDSLGATEGDAAVAAPKRQRGFDLSVLTTMIADANEDQPGPMLPWSLLDGLAELIPAEEVSICELDLVNQERELQQGVLEDEPRCLERGESTPGEYKSFWRYYDSFWQGLPPSRVGQVRSWTDRYPGRQRAQARRVGQGVQDRSRNDPGHTGQRDQVDQSADTRTLEFLTGSVEESVPLSPVTKGGNTSAESSPRPLVPGGRFTRARDHDRLQQPAGSGWRSNRFRSSGIIQIGSCRWTCTGQRVQPAAEADLESVLGSRPHGFKSRILRLAVLSARRFTQSRVRRARRSRRPARAPTVVRVGPAIPARVVAPGQPHR